MVNRFLTISTNGKQKKKPKRQENFVWNQSNSCATLKERTEQDPKMDSLKNTGVEITRVITNLVSIRNSSDAFGFFSNCSSFCLEREFQMHNLMFHFSPRASRPLRVGMNFMKPSSDNQCFFFSLIYETDVTTLLYMPWGGYKPREGFLL
mgnify:CR=1 FL=1